MRCAVLCFGNELHGDDGFGIAVGRRLAIHRLPPPWELHLVGTRGLDALALLQDCERAVMVDAQAGEGCPGRLQWRDASAMATWASREAPAACVHAAGVAALLAALRCLEAARCNGAVGGPSLPQRNAQVHLLTVQMAQCRPFEMTLSPAVVGSIEPAVSALLAFMHSDVTAAEGSVAPGLLCPGDVDVITA